MRCRIAFSFLVLTAAPLWAQHHGGSPPTAPAKAPPPPVAVSSGLGPIQFAAVSYGVPAPQSLTRQLHGDDDRTRASALAAIGVPGQYLQRSRVPTPRSIELAFVQLSNEDELDALLTVELDQHIVTAVMIPDGDGWRRVATVSVATPFLDPLNTLASFVRPERSLLNRSRYQAVFRASVSDNHGSVTENEAHLRVLNRQAVITISFVSRSRDCTAAPAAAGKARSPANGCALLIRSLQPNPAEPLKQFILISASGHLPARDESEPIGFNAIFFDAHLRSFDCQPFGFSEQTGHFEPTGDSIACSAK